VRVSVCLSAPTRATTTTHTTPTTTTTTTHTHTDNEHAKASTGNNRTERAKRNDVAIRARDSILRERGLLLRWWWIGLCRNRTASAIQPSTNGIARRIKPRLREAVLHDCVRTKPSATKPRCDGMPSVPSQRIASHRIALNQTRRNTSRDGNNEQPRVRRRQDREHGSDTPTVRVGLRARNKRTPPLRDESRSIDRCTDRGGRRTEN